MDSDLLVRCLRTATPSEQAELLREALHSAKGEIVTITSTLLAANKSGALPSPTIQTWLAVAHRPHVSALVFLRNGHNALTWDAALAHLAKHLRPGPAFDETWDALGGVPVLVHTMAGLGIYQLRRLCTVLARTSTGHADGENSYLRLKQRRITDLFDHLMDDERNTCEKRPVKPIYTRILPSCTVERALQWADRLETNKHSPLLIARDTDMGYDKLYMMMCRGHWAAFENHAFDQVFHSNKPQRSMNRLEPFTDSSFKFGIKVLKAFTESKDLRGETLGRILSSLIVPLARRCRNGHYNAEAREQLWRHINSWLEKHYLIKSKPSLQGNEWAERNLVSIADSSWDSRSGGTSNDMDFEILYGTINKLRSPSIDRRVLSQRPSARYRFLRFLLLESPGREFNIGNPCDTSSERLRGIKLSIATFTCLPGAQGLMLFERCLEGNPDFSFLCWGESSRVSGVLSQKMGMQKDSGPDIYILRAVLLQRLGEGPPILPKDPRSVLSQLRTEELDDRRKKSAQGRDPSIRSFWAISALRLALALDDLDELRENFVWIRRYVRDQLVFRDLEDFSSIFSNDLVNALSSMEAKHASHDGLKTRMEKANAVLMAILETAPLAAPQGKVKTPHWPHRTRIIAGVARARLTQLERRQQSLGISDDDAYEMVLRPTIDLLVEAESFTLKPEYGGLKTQDPLGILVDIGGICHKKPLGPHVLRFFDTLARERNDLWQRLRSQRWPDVVTLPAPWPRGLAVQHLVPSCLRQGAGCPYVHRRIEAVVFCDPAVVLQPMPDDDNLTEAVGVFVDSWTVALSLWLSELDDEDGDGRERRASQAWEHCLSRLSETQMSVPQAQRYWFEYGFRPAGFERLVESKVDSKNNTLPSRRLSDLPKPDGSGNPSEWDPDPEYPTRITATAAALKMKTDLGELTCLDSMLQAHRHGGGMPKISKLWPTATKGPGTLGFWDFAFSGETKDRGILTLKESTVDSVAAAAMLFVNSSWGADASFLMRPFPDDQQPRFPAVYLDQEFLQRPQDPSDAWSALWRLSSFVPSKLLAQLATSIMARIESSVPAERNYSRLVGIINMLAHHSPALAAPLIQRFILEFPGEGHHHQELLSPSMLRLFDARTFEHFFTSLSDSIIQRLQGQSSRSKGSSEGERPFVKVITVKLLAHLLRGSFFIDPKVSVDVLVKIARATSQVDTRLEIIKALSSNEEERILAWESLRDWVPQVAGALNERHPPTAADWEVAENGGSLPEVAPPDDSARPVLRWIAGESKTSNDMRDLTLRSLEASAEGNKRWTELFLRANGFTLGDVDLPSIPACPEILTEMVEFLLSVNEKTGAPALPIPQFETLKRYTLLLIDPPEALVAIKNSVKASAKLAQSNAGQHWLNLWTPPDLKKKYDGGDWMCKALGALSARQKDPPPFGSVTCEMLEDTVFEMAELYMYRQAWNNMYMVVDSLSPEFDPDQGVAIETRGPGRVLRRLIDRIDSLRTPEWQADANRRPSKLPDTFSLRLKLIPVPRRRRQMPSGEDIPRRHLPAAVDRIAKLLQEVVESGLPYFDQYSAIHKHVSTQVGPRLYMASLLGSTDRFRDPERPTLTEFLCVQLAASLLGKLSQAPPGQENDILAVRRMVEAWDSSAIEFLREQANKLRVAVRGNVSGKESALANWL